MLSDGLSRVSSKQAQRCDPELTPGEGIHNRHDWIALDRGEMSTRVSHGSRANVTLSPVSVAALVGILLAVAHAATRLPAAKGDEAASGWEKVAPHFKPPPEYAG